MSSDVLCGLLRWQLPVASGPVRLSLPPPPRVQDTAASLSLMRCRPSVTDLASLAASGSSGGFSAAHSQNEAMSAARSTEMRESARPDSMMGIRALAARRRLSAGVEGGSGCDMRSFYRGADRTAEDGPVDTGCRRRGATVCPTTRCRRGACGPGARGHSCWPDWGHLLSRARNQVVPGEGLPGALNRGWALWHWALIYRFTASRHSARCSRRKCVSIRRSARQTTSTASMAHRPASMQSWAVRRFMTRLTYSMWSESHS